MHDRAYKVKDGIVYDSNTADIIHYHDTFLRHRSVLAITPDGHYFLASFGGMIMGWVIFPYSRLRAVEWALRTNAPDKVLERLGMNIIPAPKVAPDKLYEPYITCELLGSKDKLFNNDFIATSEFLFKNPDGRFFLYEGMILLKRFIFEENRPMTQRQALHWAIKNMSPWECLEMLGYDRNYEPAGKTE